VASQPLSDARLAAATDVRPPHSPTQDVAGMVTHIKPLPQQKGLPPELLVTVRQDVRVPPARKARLWPWLVGVAAVLGASALVAFELMHKR
jgi:hypothetical protein